jgi:hypothetical protein
MYATFISPEHALRYFAAIKIDATITPSKVDATQDLRVFG